MDFTEFKLNKKRICILVIIIAAAIAFFIGYKIYSNKNSPKQIEFENDYERDKYVKKFAKVQGKDPKMNISTNESGYKGVFIKNKNNLLKYMNTDGVISVDNMLNQGFKDIKKINRETKALNNDDIEKYYKNNIDMISVVFGIKDFETFNKFSGEIKTLDDNINAEIGTVMAKDDKNSLNIEVDFILKANSQNFDIKVILNKNNQKDNRLIYWNV